MAHVTRKRMFHPGMHSHRKVVRLPIPARWMWSAFILNADDDGYFDADPMTWKLRVFPADNEVTVEHIRGWMIEIGTPIDDDEPLAIFVEGPDGRPVGHLPGWDQSQSIKPSIKKDSNRKPLGDAVFTLPREVGGTRSAQNSPRAEAVPPKAKPVPPKAKPVPPKAKPVPPSIISAVELVKSGEDSTPLELSEDSNESSSRSRGRGKKPPRLKSRSNAEKIRKYDLDELTDTLTRRFGDEFRPDRSHFVGWPYVQSIMTFARNCGMDPRYLIEHHIPNGIRNVTRYLATMMRNGGGRPVLPDGFARTHGWDAYMRRPRRGITETTIGDVLNQMQSAAAEKGVKP